MKAVSWDELPGPLRHASVPFHSLLPEGDKLEQFRTTGDLGWPGGRCETVFLPWGDESEDHQLKLQDSFSETITSQSTKKLLFVYCP